MCSRCCTAEAPRGRAQANPCRQRFAIGKERQLIGLKRSHNQMAGSGRPPTVSTQTGPTSWRKAAARKGESRRSFSKPRWQGEVMTALLNAYRAMLVGLQVAPALRYPD